jgi:hypothetical protein
MAPEPADVTRLLQEAARTDDPTRRDALVAQAEDGRAQITAALQGANDVDLARAIVAERLTPVRVHEHHTAATDWLGDIDTAAPADVEREMIAQGSVWYSRLPELVKQHPDELVQQALGKAARLAGSYGIGADAAEKAFLDHVGALHARDVSGGLVIVAAADSREPYELGGPATSNGLPGELTSSERAPAMQDLRNNTAGGSVSDTEWPDPLQLPQQDVDAANGDSGTQRVASQQHDSTTDNERTASMPQHTAACPECSGCQACGGTHRVAVRAPRTAASGLDQVDQVVDPHDNPKATPYPEDVAFPWEMPEDSSQAIGETEDQLKQREQLRGASRRQRAEQVAREAARQAYIRAMGGQDDSGWMGDMGAGGVAPGQQDGGNPGTTYPGNIADADPVYGQGGDNGNQPLKPYGADEANDVTNNPGMNYQPGQPTQYDQGGRANQVGQPTAGRRAEDDAQIQQALAFVRQRRALLESQR